MGVIKSQRVIKRLGKGKISYVAAMEFHRRPLSFDNVEEEHLLPSISVIKTGS